MSEAKHEPLPVAGYVPQSPESVGLVNQNKIIEERILRRLDVMQNFPEVDKRWLAIGRTQLEQAFMALNRAIFKPERVKLDE